MMLNKYQFLHTHLLFLDTVGILFVYLLALPQTALPK